MDKITFLAVLADKLSHYPISTEDVERHVRNMKRYFDTVSDEEIARENPSEEDAAVIADNIYKKYHLNRAPKAADAAEQETEPTTEELPTENEVPKEEESGEEYSESSQPSEVYNEGKYDSDKEEDYIEQLAREAEEERRVEELKQKAIELAQEDGIDVSPLVPGDESARPMQHQDEQYDPIEHALDPEQRPDIAFEEAEATRIFSTAETSRAISEFNDGDEGMTLDDRKLKRIDETKKKPKSKRQSVPGTPLFWTLFIITLPITVPLGLVVCALLGICYFAVSAFIVTFAAAMVACVAIGTALALVGIIYGVSQAIKVMPLGLFEIGFGIAIGGVTMLVSVLLYNVSIRFTPRLYKYVTRFAKYIFGKLADLYYTLKKECGR